MIISEPIEIAAQPKDVLRLKSARSWYQQGLARWLRKENPAAALALMQKSIEIVLACLAKNDSRIFLLTSHAWLDSLRLEKLPTEFDARATLSQLDRQLRALIEGRTTDTQAVLDEMLDVLELSRATDEPQVLIGEVSLSLALFELASEQASQYAQLLQTQFSVMHLSKPPLVKEEFISAAHNLAEVSQRMGFTGVVELARALENWLRARYHKAFALSNSQSQMLVQSVVALEQMVQQIREQNPPIWRGVLVSQLRNEQDKLHDAAPTVTAQNVVPQAATNQVVADDLNLKLLPLFIEEADELLPKITSTLDAWRAQTDDAQINDAEFSPLLKRLLHTLKGSARMAGAMLIGKVVHDMEDHLLTDAEMQTQTAHWLALEQGISQLKSLLEPLRAQADSTQNPQGKNQKTPFSSLGARLHAVVKNTAQELGKNAELFFQGADVELDAKMLEKMSTILQHLLRNAVVHGLEKKSVREENHKSPSGEIHLTLRQENNALICELRDDGAGLNYAVIREKAVAQGVLRADAVVTENELAQLIFVPGFSTAHEITEIAGRGIGMDVVKTEITALGGSITVNSARGVGTQFVLSLPLLPAKAQP